MKKLALASAFAVAATGLTAGGMDDASMETMAEPEMEMEEMEMEESSQDMFPFLILLLAWSRCRSRLTSQLKGGSLTAPPLFPFHIERVQSGPVVRVLQPDFQARFDASIPDAL